MNNPIEQHFAIAAAANLHTEEIDTSKASETDESDGDCEDGECNCNPAIDGFFHSIQHAEEFAEQLEDPYFASRAWSSVAQSWATFLQL